MGAPQYQLTEDHFAVVEREVPVCTQVFKQLIAGSASEYGEVSAPQATELKRNPAIRAAILGLQERMVKILAETGEAQTEMPLKHVFAPGAYAREIFIPKGTLVVGKIHKHAHLNMLMKGRVSVLTEEGKKFLEAPMTMVSPAGTKRVVYTHEDTIWVTVHLTNETDLEKIEDEVIAKSYEEFDEWIKIVQAPFVAVSAHGVKRVAYDREALGDAEFVKFLDIPRMKMEK